MLFLIMVVIGYKIDNFEYNNRNVVINSNMKNEVVFFYEDNCKNCQRIFPVVYFAGLINKRIIFVNLNGKANRKYIKEFHLNEVPTFIGKNREYVGNDIRKVLELIK